MLTVAYPETDRINYFSDLDGMCAFRSFASIADIYQSEITIGDICHKNEIEELEFDGPEEWDDMWWDAYYYELQNHIALWIKRNLEEVSSVKWLAMDVRDKEEELGHFAEEFSDLLFVALVQCPDAAIQHQPYLWHVNTVDLGECLEDPDSDLWDTYKHTDYLFFPQKEV